MAYAPGINAYVSYSAGTRHFDTWSLNQQTETVDVSNYDRRSALFVKGLPVATMTLSGPYSVGNLGLREGTEYSVTLGITGVSSITVTLLVQNIRFTHTVRGVARVEITGVVNSDFPNEATIAAL